MTALIDQGVDEKKRIIGTDAPHPFLFNLSMEMIERVLPREFRRVSRSFFVRPRCVSRTASQRQDNMAYHPALDRSFG